MEVSNCVYLLPFLFVRSGLNCDNCSACYCCQKGKSEFERFQLPTAIKPKRAVHFANTNPTAYYDKTRSLWHKSFQLLATINWHFRMVMSFIW